METINLDSSILIEHFRIKDKSKSKLFELSKYYNFAITSIVKYEILRGNKEKDLYWNNLFNYFEILPFDSKSAEIASEIYKKLKSINKLIDTDDLLIASISLKNNLKLATLNNNHFSRISGLELL
jgi:predicted nucleic acid-binding protein